MCSIVILSKPILQFFASEKDGLPAKTSDNVFKAELSRWIDLTKQAHDEPHAVISPEAALQLA